MITDLALILITASVVTLLFKRLKQPLVLGYIVSGFLVSPHMPYLASVTSEHNVHTWADIGVMFTLFALGLEFSFKKILKMGMAPVIAALVIIASMMTIGVLVGRVFGWSRMDCIFLGGMLSMSSTTIIYKAFDDLGISQQKFASMVMSVLILEDVFAIVLMVLLSSLARDGSISGSVLFDSVLNIGFFVVLWLVAGLTLIPWLLRSTKKIMTDETLTILSLGLCCAMAVFAEKVGFATAFGAFIMGSILAETVEAEKIEHLTLPIKNLFGAIFFVSVGMLVDPKILVEYALPIACIVIAILVGQCCFGTFGYLISGSTLKSAMRCGFSMAQVGEFAFIIASLGLSFGVISDYLYPVIVAVSVITTFLTPYMIRAAVPASGFVENAMPVTLLKRLNQISDIYNTSDKEDSLWRSLFKDLAAYTVICSILSAAAVALVFAYLLPVFRAALPQPWAHIIGAIVAILAMSPFLRAIVMKKNHSSEWRQLWAQKKINRVFLIATLVARILWAMAFVYYVISHLLDYTFGLIFTFALASVIIMIMSRGLKKRSIQLERLLILNIRAREEMAEAQNRKRTLFRGTDLDHTLHITRVTVPEDSNWAGQTLQSLAIAQRFGVHVSSVFRGAHRFTIPGADTVIFPNDKLQVIGNDEQLTRLSEALKTELLTDDSLVDKHDLKLRQVMLSKSSPLVGKTLIESGLRDKYNCMLVGIDEGQENLTHVNPHHRFEVGDIIWVVGETERILLLN